MGRIAKFVVGIGIMGAGYGVTYLEAFIPESPEDAQVDFAALYELLIEYGSMGVYALGALLVGYAVLSLVFSLLLANLRKRGDRKQDEQEQGQNQQQEQNQQQAQPQQQEHGRQQDTGQNQQGYGPRQQQQGQPRQQSPQRQGRQQGQDRRRQQR